jgi:apolipoprotein N-acyltransferase
MTKLMHHMHVIVMELVGKQYRSAAGLGYGIMFGVGYCIVPWLAKALKNDTYFQLAITLLAFLYMTYYW